MRIILAGRVSILGLCLLAIVSSRGATQPSAASVRSVAVNGVRLSYRVSGAGPAILLVHGSGANGNWWDSVIPQLAVDHLVIVPDLRGHGRSTNPDGRYNHSL